MACHSDRNQSNFPHKTHIRAYSFCYLASLEISKFEKSNERSQGENEQAIFVFSVFPQLGIGIWIWFDNMETVEKNKRDLLRSEEAACPLWSKTRAKFYVCGLDPKPCGRLQTMQKLSKTFPTELKENQANKTFSLTPTLCRLFKI